MPSATCLKFKCFIVLQNPSIRSCFSLNITRQITCFVWQHNQQQKSQTQKSQHEKYSPSYAGTNYLHACNLTWPCFWGCRRQYFANNNSALPQVASAFLRVVSSSRRKYAWDEEKLQCHKKTDEANKASNLFFTSLQSMAHHYFHLLV